MTFYQVPLDQIEGDGDVTLPITAGPIKMKAMFSWDATMQEQEDILAEALQRRSANDPLLAGGEYIRDYDYIDFYTSIDSMHVNEWLDNTQVIPVYISQMPRWQQIEEVEARIADCKLLQTYREALKEFLRWQCVLVTDTSKTVAAVETGGWYQHQDNSFMFRFVSDLSQIGKDQLSLVTMEIGVND